MGKRQKSRRVLRILQVSSALGAGATLAVVCLPPRHRAFVHRCPVKALAYHEAIREIRTVIARTPANIRRECGVQLFEHGHPTEQIFVLMHGLANCPAQFIELGRLLFERGHNVILPRIPYHGQQDRLATDWARLTAADMLDAGNQAVDLALGLGRRVTAAGLSINGATVAWMAQNRGDLNRAVLLAPFLAPAGLPRWARIPFERLLLRLPNLFLWWSPKEKENLHGPSYVYPRFPTRVIGETMVLGREVFNQARCRPFRCGSIVVVTSAWDIAADNRLTAELVENWRRLGHGGIDSFEFPAAERVPHDFIDPNRPNQKTALVYPKIIELLEK
jgi:pimeloyl-ACP methyl ester carboxylesterase